MQLYCVSVSSCFNPEAYPRCRPRPRRLVSPGSSSSKWRTEECGYSGGPRESAPEKCRERRKRRRGLCFQLVTGSGLTTAILDTVRSHFNPRRGRGRDGPRDGTSRLLCRRDESCRFLLLAESCESPFTTTGSLAAASTNGT